MSVPNIGPEHPDQYDPDDARKGNPAAVHRDLHQLDEIEAASTRASTVTHRFGGVRYALSRPAGSAVSPPALPPVSPPAPPVLPPAPPVDGGESDPQD